MQPTSSNVSDIIRLPSLSRTEQDTRVLKKSDMPSQGYVANGRARRLLTVAPCTMVVIRKKKFKMQRMNTLGKRN